jgi:hypothetical protein
MKKSLELQVEALHSEHLAKGIKPIMTCVGTPKQYSLHPGAEKKGFRDKYRLKEDGIQEVEYWEHPHSAKKQGFKKEKGPERDERCSYIISPINNRDKSSKEFYDCTGVIAAGKDRETGEEVSFMSHQDPKYFLTGTGNYGTGEFEKFSQDLKERLEEMRSRCKEGTVDMIVWGGKYVTGKCMDHRPNHLRSIRLLSRLISGVFGFKPTVVVGPKTQGGPDDVFYSNEERRLYLRRYFVDDYPTQSYSPTHLNKQKEKWD